MLKFQYKYLFILILIAVSVCLSQIPRQISYQGVLTDDSGNPLPNGPQNLIFLLYPQATGGAPVWSETQTVALDNGIFNVILGSVTPLPDSFDTAYWLAVSVDGSELTPRTALTSSPYTLGIADQTAVKSLNGLQDDVNLIGGDNVSVTPGDATAINISVTQPVVAYGISGATTVIGPDWTNYQNCSVTLACPGPGTVIINSTVWMRINHFQNTADRVEVCNSESPTSNTSGPPYWASYEIPASYPTGGASVDITLPIQTVFTVTEADTITYYLNGRMTNGQDNQDVFFYANIVATWYPQSQVTTSSVPILPSDVKAR